MEKDLLPNKSYWYPINGSRGIPSDGLRVPLKRAKPGGRKRPPHFYPRCAPLIQLNWSCTPSHQQTLNHTGPRKEPKQHVPRCPGGQVPSKEETNPLQKLYYKSRGLLITFMGIHRRARFLLYVQYNLVRRGWSWQRERRENNRKHGVQLHAPDWWECEWPGSGKDTENMAWRCQQSYEHGPLTTPPTARHRRQTMGAGTLEAAEIPPCRPA